MMRKKLYVVRRGGSVNKNNEMLDILRLKFNLLLVLFYLLFSFIICCLILFVEILFSSFVFMFIS